MKVDFIVYVVDAGRNASFTEFFLLDVPVGWVCLSTLRCWCPYWSGTTSFVPLSSPRLPMPLAIIDLLHIRSGTSSSISVSLSLLSSVLPLFWGSFLCALKSSLALTSSLLIQFPTKNSSHLTLHLSICEHPHPWLLLPFQKVLATSIDICDYCHVRISLF